MVCCFINIDQLKNNVDINLVISLKDQNILIKIKFNQKHQPENLLVNFQYQLKIADFGVSHIMEDRQDGRIFNQTGTQAYLAPEVLKDIILMENLLLYGLEERLYIRWFMENYLFKVKILWNQDNKFQKTSKLQYFINSSPPYFKSTRFHYYVMKLLKGMLEKNSEKKYKIEQIILDY